MRLILADGSQAGIVATEKALQAAKEANMDLVEMAPDAVPIVVKIMDYGKHIFDAKKGKATERRKQKRTQIKEVRFRPGTEQRDYEVKLRNLSRFLNEGDKARVTLRFRGREMAHRTLGMDLLKRVEVDLAEISTVELEPKMEGRQLIMVLVPRAGRKKPASLAHQVEEASLEVDSAGQEAG